ncbi:MAG: hypothetical protein AAF571_07055 [Verrucomicrobiota bacterium]
MTEVELMKLFDVETALEAGVVAALNGLNMKGYAARNVNAIDPPKVDLVAELGEATEHYHYDEATGKTYEDTWEFSLKMTVTTRRRRNGRGHSRFCSRIRVMMQNRGAAVNAKMTQHAISAIKSEGSDDGIDDEEAVDITDLEFSGVISIKPEVWEA